MHAAWATAAMIQRLRRQTRRRRSDDTAALSGVSEHLHGDASLDDRLLPRTTRDARLRRRAARRHRRRPSARPLYVYSAGDHRARATARSTRRSAATRTRSTTRSRPTRRWPSCGCCASSAAAPTPTRAARSKSRCAPASSRRDRLHRRRQDAATSSSGRSRSASQPSTPNRPASSSASTPSPRARDARARGRSRQSRHRRQSHPHISTGLQDQQVRRAARRRAGALPDVGRAPALAARRPARPHRAPRSRSSIRSPRRAPLVALAAGAADEGHRARAPRSRRRTGHLLRRTPVPSRRGLRRGDLSRVSAHRPHRSCSSRAARSSGPPGVLVTRVVDLKPQPGGERVRRRRRRHDRAAAAGAVRRLPPHRAGGAARAAPRAVRRRRARLREQRHRSAATGSCRPSRSATWWPCSTPAPTASVMASNYNRRPLPPEVLVDDGSWRVIRRRQTIDELRGARSVGQLRRLSAGSAHRVRRPRSERQGDAGEPLRDRLERHGHDARGSPRFPTTAPRSARRSRRALHGEREYAPDVMQLLYVANRYERQAGARAWLAAADRHLCDRYSPRASPTARRRAWTPRGSPTSSAFLPPARPHASCSTSRPRRPSRARRSGRDRYERDLALLTRVRESYRRQAAAQGWAAGRRA